MDHMEEDRFVTENLFDYKVFYVQQFYEYCGGPSFYHNCEDYLSWYLPEYNSHYSPPLEPPPYNHSPFPHNPNEEIYHINSYRLSTQPPSPPRSPPPPFDPIPPLPNALDRMYHLGE